MPRINPRQPRPVPSVGRFFGVPIHFAPSWLILGFALTVYYGPMVTQSVPGATPAAGYGIAIGFAVAFAVCVLLHELGHTVVALALGVRVKRVVIFLLGGVSELESDPKRPRDEFLISAAGPLVSIVVTGLSALGFLVTDRGTLGGAFVSLLVFSNAALVVFNILPALPLDGGRLLHAGVWAASGNQLLAARVGAWAGRVLAVAVGVGGLLLDQKVGLVAGVTSVLLALYLWTGATQSLHVANLRAKLPGLRVDRLLRRGLFVPGGISVAEGIRRAWAADVRGLVLVDASDIPQAIVDEAKLNAVPPDQRAWTSLSAVARSLETGLILNRQLAGEQLLDALRLTPAREYLVVDDDGKPAGILSMSDLAAALRG
jgi:Zn-dependent protease